MTESLPAQASEAARAAFVTAYGALLNGLGADEAVYFVDGVHPDSDTMLRDLLRWLTGGRIRI